MSEVNIEIGGKTYSYEEALALYEQLSLIFKPATTYHPTFVPGNTPLPMHIPPIWCEQTQGIVHS